MSALLEDLREKVASRNVLVIAGAGVTMAATGSNPIASWTGLLESGVDRCVHVVPRLPPRWGDRVRDQIHSGDIDDLLSVASQISRRLRAHGGEYGRWLRETVGSLKIVETALLEALRDLELTIATTNYDGSIAVFTGLRPFTWKQGADIERVIRGEENGIIHLHGHWHDPESVILGIESYERILNDAHAQAMLHAIRTVKTLLFVGFGLGLKDPNFAALLQWARSVFSGSEYRHYRLALEGEVADLANQHPPEERTYVLSYGTDHADLAGFLQSLRPVTPSATAVYGGLGSGAGLRSSTDDVAILMDGFANVTRRESYKPVLAGINDPLPRAEWERIEERLEEGIAVLVTGERGNGKSGLAFALCKPRADPSMPVLLLDARRYSNVSRLSDLSEELNLGERIVASIQQVGNQRGCRLVIDQLESTCLEPAGQVFVRLALQCHSLPGVQVVVLSRGGEGYERQLLDQLTGVGFVELECAELSEDVVRRVLGQIGIHHPRQQLVDLSKNLLNLSIVARMKAEDPTYDFSGIPDEVGLWRGFVDALRSHERLNAIHGISFGDQVVGEAIRLACEGMRNEDRTVALAAVTTPQLQRLSSWHILVREDGYRYRFVHEKFQDFLYAYDAVNRGCMPEQVVAEIGRHRTRTVFPWMTKLYPESNSTKWLEFLQRLLNVRIG